ncbi:radial spoke head protein 3 homolog B isoform X2 [Phlebotomus papatasi]|uniref:radial spoke head protein 3 homolog B isoform X2 n=1 Tax=Phlebotomus papatasi TaxID=29031 RepID=UPI002483E085|nr:radial spoke head protein 3 homolog B isoform X2 [Phlebotomus papatasi]
MPTVSSRMSEDVLLDDSLVTPTIPVSFSKPNAIVRPVQRTLTREASEKIFSDIGSHLTDSSEGRGALKEFVEQLDAKLKRLQCQDQKDPKKKGVKITNEIQKQRPLFITTVPTGYYVQPCKEPICIRKVYAYSSHPRVVASPDKSQQQSRKLHRPALDLKRHVISEPGVRKETLRDSNQPYQNMMFDKRVVRGSNFNANAATITGDTDHKDTAKRRQLLRKKPRNRGIVGTPPPVRGRRHENVQTDKYLEELFVRPSENDASCQTDLFLQRPPSAPFVATTAGRDAETEILEGELTHSDQEVQPVVDNLIGRCMEQAFLEVIHEEEVAEMKKEQQKLLALREAELDKLKKMNGANRETLGKTKGRVSAAKLLQEHIADLLPAILSSIQSVTEAENREELERQLRPWLAREVAEEIGHMIDSRELLGEIVKEILHERAELYGGISESESEVSLAPERKLNQIKSEDINDGKEKAVFIEGDEILYRREEK